MSQFSAVPTNFGTRRQVASICRMKVKIAMSSRAVPSNAEVCSNVSAIFGVCVLLLLGAVTAFAQAPAPASPAQEVMMGAADQNKQLGDEITELRAKVARLEAAVHETGPGRRVSSKPAMKLGPSPNNGMGTMDDKREMSMPPGMGAMTPASAAMGMKDDQGAMDGMSPGGTAAMSAKPPAAGGLAAMNGSSSVTPSQVDAPHFYHLGSNGFFLNHWRHISLTPDQILTLKHVKEKAMLNRASVQRGIDQAEQELYEFTGANQPEETRIETKIVEIEKLRADGRISFVRAVADASNVLTAKQRMALLGTTSATRK